MWSHRRRVGGRNRREVQGLLGIARAIRVMRETRGRNARARREDQEYSRVQSLPARLRERVLERAPDELVPIGERAVVETYHADAETTLDTGFVRFGTLFQQPAFGSAGDDADELCHF